MPPGVPTLGWKSWSRFERGDWLIGHTCGELPDGNWVGPDGHWVGRADHRDTETARQVLRTARTVEDTRRFRAPPVGIGTSSAASTQAVKSTVRRNCGVSGR